MTSMIAYQNDWTIFFTRPISSVVMAFTALALAWPLYRHLREVLRAKRSGPAGAVGLRHEAKP